MEPDGTQFPPFFFIDGNSGILVDPASFTLFAFRHGAIYIQFL